MGSAWIFLLFFETSFDSLHWAWSQGITVVGSSFWEGRSGDRDCGMTCSSHGSPNSWTAHPNPAVNSHESERGRHPLKRPSASPAAWEL